MIESRAVQRILVWGTMFFVGLLFIALVAGIISAAVSTFSDAGPVNPPFVPQFGTGAPGAGVPINQLYFDNSVSPYGAYVYDRTNTGWFQYGGGGAAACPAGSNNDIQYKAGSSCGGDAGLTYDNASQNIVLGNYTTNSEFDIHSSVLSGTFADQFIVNSSVSTDFTPGLTWNENGFNIFTAGSFAGGGVVSPGVPLFNTITSSSTPLLWEFHDTDGSQVIRFFGPQDFTGGIGAISIYLPNCQKVGCAGGTLEMDNNLYVPTSGTGVVQLISVSSPSINYQANFPANNGTLAELNIAQSWLGLQTFGSGGIAMTGATNGHLASWGASGVLADSGSSLSNVAFLNAVQTWAAAQTFPAGDIVLSGAVNGDIGTFNGSHALQDSGTLLSALAPLASPTFTGTATFPATGLKLTSLVTGDIITGAAGNLMEDSGTLLSSLAVGTITSTAANDVAYYSAATTLNANSSFTYDGSGNVTAATSFKVSGAGSASAPQIILNSTSNVGIYSPTTSQLCMASIGGTCYFDYGISIPLNFTIGANLSSSGQFATSYSSSPAFIQSHASTAADVGFADDAVNNGMYATGSANLGFSVGGTDELDYAITTAGVWTFKANVAFGTNTLSGLGNTTATNASGFELQNAAAAATTPTLIPNRGDTKAGIGASASGNVSIVADNGGTATEIMRFTTTLAEWIGLATDATHTDATLCEDTTTHATYFGSGTAGVCLGTSTKRAKTDLKPLKVDVLEFEKIPLYTYRYKKGWGLDTTKPYAGPMAEDVAKVFPDCVGYDKQHRPLSLDYVCLSVRTMAVVQQQQAEISALSMRLAAVEKHDRIGARP